MKSLDAYKAEQMKNPEFAAAYKELETEMNLIRALIDARNYRNMTQKELSERTGISQTEISRIENGARNPSIRLLQKLADGMDMLLKISFEPKNHVATN
ncbi:MAG: helix-turn-helix domain-containing protein [Selenomonadaceae bacterium]|nr:helix-turn-helix domain-containing protein [Selenomonadaceae bacterium]